MAQCVGNLIGNIARAVAAPARGCQVPRAKCEGRRVADPLSISPSARLLGETMASAVTASSIRSMPAPCRWTLSRKPSVGLPPPQGRPRSVLQPLLDLRQGLGMRPGFQQQRDSAGHVRRRHRGAAQVSSIRPVRAAASIGSLPPGAPMSGLKLRSAAGRRTKSWR